MAVAMHKSTRNALLHYVTALIPVIAGFEIAFQTSNFLFLLTSDFLKWTPASPCGLG